MAQPSKRDGWLLVLYLVLLLAGLAMLALGALHYYRNPEEPVLLGLGVMAVIVPACLYPIAAALAAGTARGGSGEGEGAGDSSRRTDELLETIAERLLVSDTTKRIAYREKDRQALRQAIREDMDKHDYDAALALVTEMSQVYGYRQEAEQFREQILAARRAEQEVRIQAGIAELDAILSRHEWDRALQEAAKLERLYPDSPRVKGLDRRVIDARERHKRDLERAFLDAAERDDVEKAMDLLKQLDRYVKDVEAEPLREVARGVIGKRRDNLGVQFKLAIHDKEWTQAVRIGEQIIREFPNTKMADEVRGMLDILRQHATAEQAARAGSGRDRE